MADDKVLMYDFKSSVLSPLDGTVLVEQGSEAKLYRGKFINRAAIFKERFSKKYRHPELDKSLTTTRTRLEVRALSKCHEIGIKCPTVYSVDLESHIVIMEDVVDSITVKKFIDDTFRSTEDAEKVLAPLAEKIGRDIALMHDHDLVHGDLTTTNMLLKTTAALENSDFDNLYFIDFGLSRRGATHEEKAVDFYVFERVVLSSHPSAENFLVSVLNSYFDSLKKNKDAVRQKLNEVRQRGRKMSMVG